MNRQTDPTWYPKLVDWKNWEIPVPGKEAVIGFFAFLAGSLLLHFLVIWICSWFRTSGGGGQ